MSGHAPLKMDSAIDAVKQWEPTGSRLLNPSLDWEHAWTTLNDGAEAKAGGATIDAADNTGEVDAVDFKKILIGIAKKKPEHLCEGINDHSDSLTLLMGAVNYQDLDVVEVTYEIVLKCGGGSTINVQDGQGNSAVHLAVTGGNLEVLEHLLESGEGIDYDLENDAKLTPLKMAQKSKHKNKKLLVAALKKEIELANPGKPKSGACSIL
eukprot:gene4445-12881_t